MKQIDWKIFVDVCGDLGASGLLLEYEKTSESKMNDSFSDELSDISLSILGSLRRFLETGR